MLTFCKTTSNMPTKICSTFLLLCLLLFPPLSLSFSVDEPLRRSSSSRLGKPLIGDDGIIYTCSAKFAYGFNSNGSMAWNLHLNYTCNYDIAPVYGGKRKVYVVAEKKVLRINSMNIGTSEPAVQIFFGNQSSEEKSDEIIGLSSSILTSSIYINLKNKGLFAYTLGGKLRWHTIPVLNRSGYRQGCRKNVTDCYFDSFPVIDHCEASIYMSNNQGELYSISTRKPYFKWIHDFSSFDKVFTATPGNNGRLYVTLPIKALVVCLDVSTGEVIWEKNIGPLSSAKHTPTVDSNGWLSIGSLDGFLYSISPTGVVNRFSKASPLGSVVQVNPVLDCSGYAVYISQAEMEGKSTHIVGDYTFVSAMKPKNVVFSLLVPSTGSFYWSDVYPGQFASNLSRSDLRKFILDEEMVLAFIAAAKIGNPYACRSTSVKLADSCSEVRPKSVNVYTGNERTILLFLLFETVMLVLLAVIVRFCCIFWGKQKVQNQGLGKFLETRRSLRLKKKEFDQAISELSKAASEEATTSDVLEKASGLVRRREGIERKLSTTYSLGKDSNRLSQRSELPVYDTKTRSYSFQGSKNESVTIFHTFSDASSNDESSQHTDSEEDLQREIELTTKGKAKVDEPIEMVSSSDEDDDMEEINGNWLRSNAGSIRFSRGLYVDDDERQGRILSSSSNNARRAWLKRRRSLSSTN